MGIVLSGDLFNIYVMLEVMTFAAVGLTAFRTWNPNAREAAFKYLVVGSIGSTCVLLGTALVYAQCHTLNLAQISRHTPGQHEPDHDPGLCAALHRLRLQELHVPLPPHRGGRPRRRAELGLGAHLRRLHQDRRLRHHPGELLPVPHAWACRAMQTMAWCSSAASRCSSA